MQVVVCRTLSEEKIRTIHEGFGVDSEVWIDRRS